MTGDHAAAGRAAAGVTAARAAVVRAALESLGLGYEIPRPGAFLVRL